MIFSYYERSIENFVLAEWRNFTLTEWEKFEQTKREDLSKDCAWLMELVDPERTILDKITEFIADSE